MFGHLQIEERGRPARVVDLIRSATIGRTADNDIVLDSDGVSHCHAMLLTQPSGVDLVDLGSTFGTLIDNVPAPPDEPVRLIDGARIKIGRAALRFLAPRITVDIPFDRVNAAPSAPPLAVAHLNTRFQGFGADHPLEVGRPAALLVWVGAPIPTDECQSSRPLRLASGHLASQLALEVRVRAVSPAWRVRAEQPTLLAERWGSAQIARYQVTPQRPERTRLTVRVEHGGAGTLLQQVQLGLLAIDCQQRRNGRTPARGHLVEDLPAPRLPLCRSCFAQVRDGARFCHACGAKI